MMRMQLKGLMNKNMPSQNVNSTYGASNGNNSFSTDTNSTSYTPDIKKTSPGSLYGFTQEKQDYIQLK